MDQSTILNDLESCIEWINEVLEPIDPVVLGKMNRVVSLLRHHCRIEEEQCKALESQLADELQANSDNLRTLATMKHKEDRFKNNMDKSHRMMDKMRQREQLHRQVVKETENLQRDVDQRQELIFQLKHEIRILRKKMLPSAIKRAPIIHKCL